MSKAFDFLNKDPGKADEPSAIDWLENNIAKPAYNAGIVTPGNAAGNALNFVTNRETVGKLTPYKVDAPRSTMEEVAQITSTALAGVVPYAVVGKVAGSTLRATGVSLGLEGGAARLFASETTGLVVGAAAIDGFRDVHQGETRLGNAVGGMAAFGIFGIGNKYAAQLPFVDRVITQAAIGAGGSGAQLLLSSGISGERVSADEVIKAGFHGATTNVLLPRIQHCLGKVSDVVNIRLGRGVSVNRFVENQNWEHSSLLNAERHHNPLARVQPDALSLGSSVTHGNKLIKLGQDAGAAELTHELSHLRLRTASEPAFQDIGKLLSSDPVQAKIKYLELRHEQERTATEIGLKVQNKTTDSPQSTPYNRGAKEYIDLFESDWNKFVASGGKARPELDLSTSTAEYPPLEFADVRLFAQMQRTWRGKGANLAPDAEAWFDYIAPRMLSSSKNQPGAIDLSLQIAKDPSRGVRPGAHEFKLDGTMLLPSTERSGPITQAIAFNHMLSYLRKPHSQLNGRTPEQFGYELIPIRSSSVLDGIGWDMMLVDKKTGDFLHIDVKEYTPGTYPDFHIRNAIFDSSHKGEKCYPGEERVIQPRSEAFVHTRMNDIFGRLHRDGSPYNLVTLPLPSSHPLHSPDHTIGWLLTNRKTTPAQAERLWAEWDGSVKFRQRRIADLQTNLRALKAQHTESGNEPHAAIVGDLLGHSNGHRRFLVELETMIKERNLREAFERTRED